MKDPWTRGLRVRGLLAQWSHYHRESKSKFTSGMRLPPAFCPLLR